MPEVSLDFDVEQAISWLMRFLAVEGVTGQEQAIGKEVVKVLGEIGVPASAIAFDRAHEKIPVPTQTGNLIVKLKGNRREPRRLFMTHLDTVPLCAGAVPLRKGNRIVADSPTALGADNRTGVACVVNLIANLVKHDLPHPPTTALFTVREESGLWGARFVQPKDLGDPAFAFNVDGGSPGKLTIGAVGADRWTVEIRGKASHAGVHPEEGISATMVAALALANIHQGGWFGRIQKNGKSGTSNVGSVGDQKGGSAGVATNVVTDYVFIRGESRSHDDKFVGEITRAYKDAFRNAARQVTDNQGRSARVSFVERWETWTRTRNARQSESLSPQLPLHPAWRFALAPNLPALQYSPLTTRYTRCSRVPQ
jgi:tripeptide aminopeptidase